MSKKVYVTVKVNLCIVVDEGTVMADVINELDYTFADTTGNADVIDSSIEDFEVTDSK